MRERHVQKFRVGMVKAHADAVDGFVGVSRVGHEASNGIELYRCGHDCEQV